ncbi:hypothetical protein NMY22_g10923 [Coprinellus aureogranulatus]|nr:hypothetical protein NMY22_g10923 [Coprinellus aureogranulatus]
MYGERKYKPHQHPVTVVAQKKPVGGFRGGVCTLYGVDIDCTRTEVVTNVRIVGFLFGFSLASSLAAYHLLEEYQRASAALQASVDELKISTEKVSSHVRRIEAVEKDLQALTQSSASKEEISKVRAEVKKLYDGLHVEFLDLRSHVWGIQQDVHKLSKKDATTLRAITITMEVVVYASRYMPLRLPIRYKGTLASPLNNPGAHWMHLGYYFVSFRAMRVRQRGQALKEMQNAGENEEVPVGEANVYLAVFNEGICCFHYRDISEHIDRVRSRIALLDEVVNMSSDWIAHGIMDSVVDSFFPVLAEIEKEVMAIDNLVYFEDDEDDQFMEFGNQEQGSSAASSTVKAESEIGVLSPKTSNTEYQPYEKPALDTASSTEGSIRFVPPRPTPRLVFRRARRYVGRVFSRLWKLLRRREAQESRINPRTMTLRRMAKTRKLVTLLSRLLASKADVVTQIRKRLMQAGEPSLGNGGTKGEEMEVAIYMGDVQGV